MCAAYLMTFSSLVLLVGQQNLHLTCKTYTFNNSPKFTFGKPGLSWNDYRKIGQLRINGLLD